MRSKIYIISISLLLCLLFPGEADACTDPSYYPYGYRLYRGYDGSRTEKVSLREMNCLLWQKMSSPDISLGEIEEVVYSFDEMQLKQILQKKQTNLFAEWIRQHRQREFIDFLLLARACEKARALQNDPWYYPSESDGIHVCLEDIADRAGSYNGSLLKDRYMLQKIRALFALRDYRGCVDCWEKEGESLPEEMSRGIIAEMCRSYIAGARFRLGEQKESLDYFIKAADLESVRLCARKMGMGQDNLTLMGLIRKTSPNAPDFAKLMQEEIGKIEISMGADELSYTQRIDSCPAGTRQAPKVEQMLDLSRIQIADPRVKDHAFWYYSAAFLADLLGRPEEAEHYLVQAERLPASSFLKESIQVMRIYLDARLSKYDAAYEQKLYRQIRWLDSRIQRDMGAQEGKDALCDDIWKLKACISFYYWNDVMRKILIAEAAPRMMDSGRAVRALQLINLADNRLPGLLGEGFDKACRADYNMMDYSNYFFRLADRVDAGIFRKYVEEVEHPASAVSAGLNRMGYTDRDYLYELLGTKYLRINDYQSAVRYLGKVSGSYQNRTNIRHYILLDPFQMDRIELEDRADYKYRFARKMLDMEKELASLSGNPDRKALYLVRMGIGIRNSIGSCWPLTEYHKDVRFPDHDRTQARKKAMACFKEGLATVQDPDLGAELHRRLFQWKSAAIRYPDTEIAKSIRSGCDRLCDYGLEKAFD